MKKVSVHLLTGVSIVLMSGVMLWCSPVSFAAPAKGRTTKKSRAKVVAKKPASSTRQKSVPSKTPAQLQTEYAAKVNKIVGDVIVPLSDISFNAEWYGKKMAKVFEWKEGGADYMDELRQKYEFESEDHKKKVKANLPLAQKLLKQLRAISPVPRSLAGVDKGIGQFCQDAESALSMIDFGLDQNDFAPVTVGQQNLSRAFGVLNKATDELKLRTAPAQQSKKYVDG